ncbi:SUMO-specific isopeptidase USPL1 isoform X1 [Kogia breviceps]|uniref:SUMO-specific isopeptidase USPL1 isoform X1 n=2 Tax=Kogia breviceps TaxID=27615 RepID=UPI0027951F03|nr:SUMO-specific isopeptidase USPL1 isoform X1 [Kogia breviceps]XP_058897780.1 SUMO-specific isopeptidase USPL1 isoform X1 [Kogia breviceps]
MMDSPKIGNGLPVIGPGTGIGISSLHMVGYLGKNYDSSKVPSDGYCPACRTKGKLKALKTYRISFQESVFLCEDLQCIYPLGSKSLNNLITPDLEDCHTPNKPQKRKIVETNYKDSPLLANSKRTKNHSGIGGEQVLNSKHNEEEYDETSSDLPGLLRGGQQNPIRTTDSLEQNEILEADVVDMAAKEDSTMVDVSGTGGTSPQNEGCTSELEMLMESKHTSFCQTSCVQWKNAHALCWLDCILSALVHLEGLKNTVTDLCSKEESVFGRLFTRYNQANEFLHISQLDGVKDGDCKKLPSEIFAKIETCLNEVRGDIFIRLQPQLRCTLGDMESPVFAFPLLLKTEPHVEKLFTYSFSWNFECSHCGHKYQNRCMKNLVTFTNVVPEWHPVNAAHFGPCNNCNDKSQIRKMVLEKVSLIFMLHFVEGLPHNDLQHYSFHSEGCLYQITSVIQYQANNHFITWTLDADGSWLECDDLKGPCSERHEKFQVPASEIHIVIWERKTSQMTDKAPACCPLKKTYDQHAFRDENQVSPALCSVGDAASAGMSSGTHPTNVSVAPNTLSQDEAVTFEHHLFSGLKGLVDKNISPLTFEEIQVNSEGFLLENKPVAENAGVVKTHTLQSQESLMASLVSTPCKDKLTQDQRVDLSFSSQLVNTNVPSVQLNTEDTVVTQPVNDIRATDLTQRVKSVETEGTVALEKGAPSKQFLLPKTAKLKPEQHVTSQVSDLKEKEAATSSQTITAKPSQNPFLKENQKKPFVGSWVKGLLSKGVSFMPFRVSAHNRNTVTDLQPSVKGASNFGGFKTKGTKQKGNWASREAHRCAGKPPPVSNPAPGHPSPVSIASPLPANGDGDLEVLKKCEHASYGVHLSHSSHGNENGVSSANHGDSVEGQIHKLRLKLLKKLKAKKKKLAALMSSPQNGTLPSENLEHMSHCGSPNDGESIEDLLKELQHQIDIADSKSGCATVPSVSSYGSQTHEEILAELLSPTTVVSTELSENEEADFRYLEMGDNHIPAPVPNELNNIPQNIHLRQDHNYCSPTKKNQCKVQPDSLTSNAYVTALNSENPMKTDIFDEFFSTSALNSLASDTLDFPHFDEYLFEDC